MIDVSKTTEAKSDQLNADDLIGGPITVKITAIKGVEGDQPIWLSYEGDHGKPYKPGKSMRRALVYCWGNDGGAYVGRSMTLYTDKEVTFGKIKVGGIRISHMSHIDGSVTFPLTVSRAKKEMYTVQRLVEEKPASLQKIPLEQALSSIEIASDSVAVDAVATALNGYTWGREDRLAISQALKSRREAFARPGDE